MFTWTKESIEWLDVANNYTNYSKNLALKLLPYLDPHYRVLEIACGTGHLAMELSPYVKMITAVDISQLSIDFFKDILKTKSINNIEIICDDWKNLIPSGEKYDLITFSYFGAILDDLELLKQFSPKTIIPILPYYKPKTRFSDGERAGKRENVENVEIFLKEKNMNFQLLKTSLEYGQPFSTMDNALKYMSHYYPNFTSEENSTYLEKHLTKENTQLYLPKQKDLGIFVINL